MPVHNNLITLEEIKDARDTVYKSSLGVVRTPLMKNCQDMFPPLKDVQLYIKMENTQTTGTVIFTIHFSSVHRGSSMSHCVQVNIEGGCKLTTGGCQNIFNLMTSL